MSEKENVFITWHYTTHGIAYLKHILSAFYTGVVSIDNLNVKNISQERMNEVFKKKNTGFLFDRIYYLTAPQTTFDNISARRFNYGQQILEKDKLVKESNALEIWEDLLKEHKTTGEKKDLYNRFEKIEEVNFYVKNKYPEELFEEWSNQVWRDVQHLKIKHQINWFRKFSNAHVNYKNKEIFIEEEFTKLDDLRDPMKISKNLRPFIDEIVIKHPNANIVINAVLGSNETQVVWQIFSELSILPKQAKLIRTYDNKAHNPNERFKDFNIEQIPNKIVSEIKKASLYDESPKSKAPSIAEKKFQNYIKQGFAILLIGDRGIGKSRMAEQNSNKKEVVVVNCATFYNDDLALSQLFGYNKGAFTGANEITEGFFQLAKDKILFFDEIHHLSKTVQSQLFRAIQTDDDNNFTIRKIGSAEEEKIQTTLIFATNIKVKELKKKLLPDFYDRIVQLVIEMPSLKDSRDDLPELFKSVWGNMKFDNYIEDKGLLKWIKTLKLDGNYRDLQRIAILYKSYNDFDEDLKKKLNSKYKFPFEFAKKQYEKYIDIDMEDNDLLSKLFSDKLNEIDLMNLYRRELSKYFTERYNGAKLTSEHFHELKGKITPETLYRWKNAKLSFEN